MHILLLTYISPYLAATCFGWSPYSGISKSNNLKFTAINSPYDSMHVNVEIILKFALYKYKHLQNVEYDK